MATDVEAVVYLMLQNQMLHDLFPTVVTIGEDVSGMPTFCRRGPLPLLCLNIRVKVPSLALRAQASWACSGCRFQRSSQAAEGLIRSVLKPASIPERCRF